MPSKPYPLPSASALRRPLPVMASARPGRQRILPHATGAALPSLRWQHERPKNPDLAIADATTREGWKPPYSPCTAVHDPEADLAGFVSAHYALTALPTVAQANWLYPRNWSVTSTFPICCDIAQPFGGCSPCQTKLSILIRLHRHLDLTCMRWRSRVGHAYFTSLGR